MDSVARNKSPKIEAGIGRVGSFHLLFAMGKIRGTPCIRSHTILHRATTKFFDNPFAFKNEIEKEGRPRGSTPGLGAGGPEFKSRRPDQTFQIVPSALSASV